MLFGTDSSAWAQMNTDVQGLTSYRGYFQPADGMPKSITSLAGTLPQGVVPILSIKPNISEYMAGGLDGAYAEFCDTLPDGTMVTAYHEGNRDQDASILNALHGRLKAKTPSNIKAGAIYSAYKPKHGQDLTPFIAPGLDFYCIDGYQADSADDAPWQVFGDARRAIVTAAGSDAPWGITETNTIFNQAEWLEAAFNYAVTYKAFAFAPFFNSPPSDPNAYKYVSFDVAPVLRELAVKAAWLNA